MEAVDQVIATMNERVVGAFNEYVRAHPEFNGELLEFGHSIGDDYLAKILARFPRHAAAQSEDIRGRILFFIACRLEHGCRQFAVNKYSRVDLASYATITFQICDYLRDPQAELLRAIVAQRIRATRVAFMNSHELCPSFMRVEREAFEERKRQKIVPKVSHIHTCAKCGKKETHTREVQTRSSDEAPTLFIQCASCGHHWRLDG